MVQISTYKNEFIDSRSTLYNLQPVGIGTEMTESLTSYLTRLSLEHNTTVGNLVNKLIIPAMSKEYLLRSSDLGGNRFYEGAKTLNGFMENSLDVVVALEKLTCRDDLKQLTLLNWRGLIPLKGLFKKSLSWCPCCINEWIDKGTTIYYPLIWYLEPIKICHIHSCYLINTCPSCQKKQDILRRQSIVGYCQNCFESLDGDVKTESCEQKVYDWQSFIIRNISTLLTTQKQFLFDGKLRLVTNLNVINETIFDGSIINFSKQLSFARSTVNGWLKGMVTPTLESLFHICFRLSIEVEHLLFKPLDFGKVLISEDKKSEDSSLFKDSKKLDYQIIQKQLEGMLKSEEVLSMEATAEIIGVSKRTLYRNFNDLCIRISKKYKEYLEARKRERLMDLKMLLEASFTRLFEEGIYPSRRKMEFYMNKPGVLKERELQLHWKGLLLKKDLINKEFIKDGDDVGNEIGRI